MASEERSHREMWGAPDVPRAAGSQIAGDRNHYYRRENMMGLIRLIAIVALTIAWLGAAAVISGVNVTAWLAGGLLAWCISQTTDYVLPVGRRVQ